MTIMSLIDGRMLRRIVVVGAKTSDIIFMYRRRIQLSILKFRIEVLGEIIILSAGLEKE